MYRALDERQFALQEQGEDTYERGAKIKVRKMIIDAELEERRHLVHRVSTRSAREREQGEYSKGMRVPGKVRGNSLYAGQHS
jgi:hypothetical protein